MIHLPKINQENTLFDCRELKSQQSENVIFDKTTKSFVLKVGPSNLFTYHNSNDVQIKGSKIYIQMYLIEKLKFILELSNKQEYFRIVVSPNLQQAYSKKLDEVKISSAFILTNKWISLSFDIESFFKDTELQFRMLSIHSLCRLKKIYEGTQTNNINDGQCLIQKICEKRILELLPNSTRAQSEKTEIRKNQFGSSQQRRLSTISNSQEKIIQTESDSKKNQSKQKYSTGQEQQKNSHSGLKTKSQTLNLNQNPKRTQLSHQKQSSNQKNQFQAKSLSQQQPLQSLPIHNQTFNQNQALNSKGQLSQISSNRSKKLSQVGGNLTKQLSQECLLEKTIKLATGLQVIEEVNINKPPVYAKSSSNKFTAQTQLQKKAVQSFLRHTQEFQNGSHFSHEQFDDSKTDNEFGYKYSQVSQGVKDLYYEGDNSEYQTKYGKFSSTFTRPLGLSSYNHRLSSQQSQNQQQGSTNEQFYLSSQQLEQNFSPNQTVNEIEEQIDAPEIKSKITDDSFNSINGLQIRQEDSSEDLAVSKFE
ncbi:unnamed protein product [Paramecium octaurelia]|uniref:CFA20 domain-containing protein n=1 Tax=Paramecium octaurelia TaxID=43137 RepID=A0A8S1TIG5_PAROT|nr:unnamed protein product [Paramecium octaurelia]